MAISTSMTAIEYGLSVVVALLITAPLLLTDALTRHSVLQSARSSASSPRYYLCSYLGVSRGCELPRTPLGRSSLCPIDPSRRACSRRGHNTGRYYQCLMYVRHT